jgi:hypothetical protein
VPPSGGGGGGGGGGDPTSAFIAALGTPVGRGCVAAAATLTLIALCACGVRVVRARARARLDKLHALATNPPRASFRHARATVVRVNPAQRRHHRPYAVGAVAVGAVAVGAVAAAPSNCKDDELPSSPL